MRCFLVILIVFATVPLVIAQTKKNYSYQKESKRWVLSPTYYPVLYLANRQFDAGDEAIERVFQMSNVAGLRFESYFPNRALDYILELNYSSRNITYRRDELFHLTEHALGFSPRVSLKTGGFEQLKHYFLEFGIQGQLIVNSSLDYYQNSRRISPSRNLVKSTRWWAYLGAGIKQDRFYTDSGRIGLSNLSFGLLLPFFNQGNTFKNYGVSFPGAFDLFEKNRTTSIMLSLTATQQLDLRANNLKSGDDIPCDYAPSNRDMRFTPPLVSFSKPRKWIFGNFFLNSQIQPKVDSIPLRNQGELHITNIKQTHSFEFGYSVHFLGNYPKYMSCRDMQVSNDSGVRYNFFGSIGFRQSLYQLDGEIESMVSRHSVFVAGGARIGLNPIGIYVLGGYRRDLSVDRRFYTADRISKNFSFGNRSSSSIFLGFSFRNSLVIKANYYNFETLKDRANFLDRIEFSIGFGI